MTNFAYNNGIPAAANDPSADQPLMLINTQSTENLLAVDHVSFSSNDGGTHKQVTFSSKNTPGAQTDPASTLYTASGTASTKADLRFKNQNATFPINLIRAFGVVDNTGTILSNQQFNIASVTHNGSGDFTIVMNANTTGGVPYGILISTTSNLSTDQTFSKYSITNATTFNLNFYTGNFVARDPNRFTFIVLQV